MSGGFRIVFDTLVTSNDAGIFWETGTNTYS